MRVAVLLLYLIVFNNFPNRGLCQTKVPVKWDIDIRRVAGDTIVLRFRAILAPGWYTYSQFMEPGGPYPTRILFDSAEDFTFYGRAEEGLNQRRYFDEIYGIEIISYADEVLFTQKMRAISSSVVLTGTIEYMACNGQVCLPAKYSFSMNLDFP